MKRSLLLLGVWMLAACKEEPRSQGTPPPAPPSATAAVAQCAGGGGQVKDAISAPFFPRTAASGSYCLDPQGDEKTYGEKAKLVIDQLCTTALDGGCEEYKKFGVTRSVIVHYVAAAGTGSVEVFLSEFAGDGAFAIYTTRLTGEVDPADEHAPRPMKVSGLGATGTGKAYVQRGPYFLELTYSNDQETPDQMKKSSDAILPALAAEISAKLPDKPETPTSAKALPEAEHIPNGTLYYPKDLLGVTGAGPGAVGYYRGAKRYRIVSAVRETADQAKDVLHTLRGKPGALPVANLGDEAVVVVLQPSPERAKLEWVVARKGASVLGVGDEEFALQGDAKEQAAARLSKDDKVAKLRGLIK